MADKSKDPSILIHSLSGATSNPPKPHAVQQQSQNQRPAPESKPKNNTGGDNK